MRHIYLIILIYFFTSIIPGCSEDKSISHSGILVGQSKQTIIELIGDPDETKNTRKNEKYIWGPEEEFWDEIPIGSRLEIWGYDFTDGHLNLYFVNGSDSLTYKAFAPQGVVYEAEK